MGRDTAESTVTRRNASFKSCMSKGLAVLFICVNFGVNAFDFAQLSRHGRGWLKGFFLGLSLFFFFFLLLATPADLSRKDIWFLLQLPVRNTESGPCWFGFEEGGDEIT